MAIFSNVIKFDLTMIIIRPNVLMIIFRAAYQNIENWKCSYTLSVYKVSFKQNKCSFLNNGALILFLRMRFIFQILSTIEQIFRKNAQGHYGVICFLFCYSVNVKNAGYYSEEYQLNIWIAIKNIFRQRLLFHNN